MKISTIKVYTDHSAVLQRRKKALVIYYQTHMLVLKNNASLGLLANLIRRQVILCLSLILTKILDKSILEKRLRCKADKLMNEVEKAKIRNLTLEIISGEPVSNLLACLSQSKQQNSNSEY
jgi:hypothetical protein